MINVPEKGFSQDPQPGDQKEFSVYGPNLYSAVRCCSFQLFNMNLKNVGCCKIVTYFSWYEFTYL